MKDWLLDFYRRVGKRNVILLINNLSAHVEGAKLALPPSNVRIHCLPANSTSIYQPLDQGIIQNLKVHYRERLLHFQLSRLTLSEEDKAKERSDKEKSDDVKVCDAICWATGTWYDAVTPGTIGACFRKSSVFQRDQSNMLPAPDEHLRSIDIQGLYDEVARAGQIQHKMSLENFRSLVRRTRGMDSLLSVIIDKSMSQ